MFVSKGGSERKEDRKKESATEQNMADKRFSVRISSDPASLSPKTDLSLISHSHFRIILIPAQVVSQKGCITIFSYLNLIFLLKRKLPPIQFYRHKTYVYFIPEFLKS